MSNLLSNGPCHLDIPRNDASWNLARVSTRTKLAKQDPFALDYQYKYNSGPGSGVDIYVVDTGLSFPCFSNGSVSPSTYHRCLRSACMRTLFG